MQACAKHFAANNIEDTRIYVNAVLDERTLREVYLPHFKKAVDAGVACVMTSYNRVNGSYNGYSKALVRDILKDEWGFPGWVISDWFAKGHTLTSPAAGLDVEMPFSSGRFPAISTAPTSTAPLVSRCNNGQVDVKLVDEAVLRILYAKVHNGVIDDPVGWRPYLTKSDPAQALALQAAREGIVLLKNGPTRALADDVLPLVTGRHGQGRGGGQVRQQREHGRQGLQRRQGGRRRAGDHALRGLAPPSAPPHLDHLCGGVPKCALTFENVAGNEAAIRRRRGGGGGRLLLRRPRALEQRRGGRVEGPRQHGAAAARPRQHRRRGGAQGANPNLKVVVVMKSGGAVVVDPTGLAGVDAVLMAWFAGMKEGTALARSSSATSTRAASWSRASRWPSPTCRPSTTPPPATWPTTTTTATAGSSTGACPAVPLRLRPRYTTFAYSNLQVANAPRRETGTLTVKVDVKNTGPVAGSEVVQLYVGFANTAVADTWGRPMKELKAFARAEDIAPGATQTVTLNVKAADLAYWDVAAKAMTVEKMAYPLFVGPSSSRRPEHADGHLHRPVTGYRHPSETTSCPDHGPDAAATLAWAGRPGQACPARPDEHGPRRSGTAAPDPGAPAAVAPPGSATPCRPHRPAAVRSPRARTRRARSRPWSSSPARPTRR